MGNRINMVGLQFGRLTVISDLPADGSKNRRVRCLCLCGTETSVFILGLRQGKTRSCGCLHRDSARIKATKHGKSKTIEWKIWCNVIDRCENSKSTYYRDYGGRGISIHPSWRHDFSSFYQAVGPRPSPKHSLDRIDNDGDYAPGNVRWATKTQQARNCRWNQHLTINSERKTIAEWAEIAGIKYATFWGRVKNGWPKHRLFLPVRRPPYDLWEGA